MLLTWKNWIIQIRHPIQTIFEILVPIAICAFIVLIRGLVKITEYDEDTRYPPLSTTTIGNAAWLYTVNPRLIYSPENPVFARIVNNASEGLGFTLPVLGVANSQQLLNSAKVLQPFASIEFEDSLQVMEFCFKVTVKQSKNRLFKVDRGAAHGHKLCFEISS